MPVKLIKTPKLVLLYESTEPCHLTNFWPIPNEAIILEVEFDIYRIYVDLDKEGDYLDTIIQVKERIRKSGQLPS